MPLIDYNKNAMNGLANFLIGLLWPQFKTERIFAGLFIARFKEGPFYFLLEAL